MQRLLEWLLLVRGVVLRLPAFLRQFWFQKYTATLYVVWHLRCTKYKHGVKVYSKLPLIYQEPAKTCYDTF